MKKNDRGEGVVIMQRWLNHAEGTKLATDGVFGPMTENALRAFQAKHRLATDGLFGPQTFRKLQQEWRPDKLSTVQERVPADQWGKGYDHHRLRGRDAAVFYREFYKACKEHGIIVTSSGSLRSLNAPVSVGRSATSLHYLSVAFDLNVGSGLADPERNPYVCTLNSSRNAWTVWARVLDPDAPKAPTEEMEIQRPITVSARWGRNKATKGKFVNFTELAAQYGFMPVPPWRTFLSGGSWITAEWWHFQNEWCLMPGFSTLGGELALAYPMHQLQGTRPMRNAGVVWKKNWRG